MHPNLGTSQRFSFCTSCRCSGMDTQYCRSKGVNLLSKSPAILYLSYSHLHNGVREGMMIFPVRILGSYRVSVI